MISRQVMFNNVHYFLGPYASVRPFTYQQREGYLINNPGGPLTKVFVYQVLLIGVSVVVERN